MQKRILSLLVDNTAGVLSRIAGLFSRRGYNIDSLTVGVTADERYSRMTVVCSGDTMILEQITKQLTNAEEELKQPFLQEQELSDKSARLAELDALLNVGNDAPIIEGEAEELEEEPEDALIQSDDELER